VRASASRGWGQPLQHQHSGGAELLRIEDGHSADAAGLQRGLGLCAELRLQLQIEAVLYGPQHVLCRVANERAVEEKEPILVIKTSITLGTETVTAIEYRDQFLGLGITENNVEVSIGPNPANEQLNVLAAATIEEWSFINSDGQVVRSATHASNSLAIDLSPLATGQYHLVLVTAKGISYQKFVKQ
jgi:hypothetical protein